MNARPIGMFDSGFGGLTVARAVIDLLPNENLVYIGDTARYPYGPKPAADVREYAIEIANSLVNDFDAKMIVVACNTAASVALSDLQSRLQVPVIGVVEPGARALVRVTKNKKVGVIGTTGTINSRAYDDAVAQVSGKTSPQVSGKTSPQVSDSTSHATSASVDLTTRACPGFVEFVERNETSGEEITKLAETLLAPVRQAGVDALLLGCTHYPYLSDVIGKVMGQNVILVNSAEETAVAVRDALGASASSRSVGSGEKVVHEFFSSGDVQQFAELGRRFLGPELSVAKLWQSK